MFVRNLDCMPHQNICSLALYILLASSSWGSCEANSAGFVAQPHNKHRGLVLRKTICYSETACLDGSLPRNHSQNSILLTGIILRHVFEHLRFGWMPFVGVHNAEDAVMNDTCFQGVNVGELSVLVFVIPAITTV